MDMDLGAGSGGTLFNPTQLASGIFGRSRIRAKRGFGFLKRKAQVNLNAGGEVEGRNHLEQRPCQTEAAPVHLKHFTEIKSNGAKKVMQRTKVTSPIAQNRPGPFPLKVQQ